MQYRFFFAQCELRRAQLGDLLVFLRELLFERLAVRSEQALGPGLGLVSDTAESFSVLRALLLQ